MDRISIPDVMTLEETSEYLRLPVEIVLKQALKGNIPGRKACTSVNTKYSTLTKCLEILAR